MESPSISPQMILIFMMMTTENVKHKEKAQDVIGPGVLK